MNEKKYIIDLRNRILDGYQISNTEALRISSTAEPETLYESANKIRENFNGSNFDLCSILNIKSGKCSENCRFCAQSIHFDTEAKAYDILPQNEVIEYARKCENNGIKRLSLVSSGKNLTEKNLEKLIPLYKKISSETSLKLCASHGLITIDQAERLKDAGVNTYHHNLEAGKNYFHEICTTHSYEDRINTIKNAIKGGLEICSGGIIGLGETMENRIEMALEIRSLGIKSIPVNILNPIKGTPLEEIIPLKPQEILRTIAVYRFILPDAFIRYAGGRKSLGSDQVKGLNAGINAAITGDYLTTTGNNITDDKKKIASAGFIL